MRRHGNEYDILFVRYDIDNIRHASSRLFDGLRVAVFNAMGERLHVQIWSGRVGEDGMGLCKGLQIPAFVAVGLQIHPSVVGIELLSDGLRVDLVEQVVHDTAGHLVGRLIMDMKEVGSFLPEVVNSHFDAVKDALSLFAVDVPIVVLQGFFKAFCAHPARVLR